MRTKTHTETASTGQNVREPLPNMLSVDLVLRLRTCSRLFAAKERETQPSKGEHSPLPWQVEGSMKILSGIRYTANCFLGSGTAKQFEESKANAAFIVEACNNYDRVVKGNRILIDAYALTLEKLERVKKERDELLEAMESVLFVARGAADENNLNNICRIAQSAIAKVTKANK